jgi:hypothetical protein
MVNYSSNIIGMNNPLSPQTIADKKDHDIALESRSWLRTGTKNVVGITLLACQHIFSISNKI